MGIAAFLLAGCSAAAPPEPVEDGREGGHIYLSSIENRSPFTGRLDRVQLDEETYLVHESWDLAPGEVVKTSDGQPHWISCKATRFEFYRSGADIPRSANGPSGCGSLVAQGIRVIIEEDGKPLIGLV